MANGNRNWCPPSAPPSSRCSDLPFLPLYPGQIKRCLFAPSVPPSPFGYDPNRDPNLTPRPRWPLPNYILPGGQSSKMFFRQVGDPNCRDEHYHEIIFNGEGFIVDGEFRNLNDPQSVPFLNSLNDCECPAEFNKPGSHCIMVRGNIGFPPDYAEQVKALASFVDPSKPMISRGDMRGEKIFILTGCVSFLIVGLLS